MRELLKEAAQALETVQHYFPAQDEADKGLAVADVDACQRLMTKIEACLAEPEPDAKWESIISKIRATDSKGEYRLDYWSAQKLIEEFAEQHAQAAAMIESYGRRVPRAMLEEAYLLGFHNAIHKPASIDMVKSMDDIAAHYGADVDACQRLMTKIEACLAEPEPDATEIVDKIREKKHYPELGEYDTTGGEHTLTDSEAAALIADYGRRVPRAMLEEIEKQAFQYGKEPFLSYETIDVIAAKHGVKLEG